MQSLRITSRAPSNCFLWFQGGCPMKGVYISQGGRSVHSPPIFLFWNAKFQKFKIFACGASIFNTHIFRFKMDAGLQVDIDFNTEFNFSYSRNSFFSQLSGHSKTTKPMKLLSAHQLQFQKNIMKRFREKYKNVDFGLKISLLPHLLQNKNFP